MKNICKVKLNFAKNLGRFSFANISHLISIPASKQHLNANELGSQNKRIIRVGERS